jgi:Skp family chaperone for outer membrane proteins
MKIDDTEKEIKIDDDFFKMPEENLKTKINIEEEGFASKINHLLPVLLPVFIILIIIVGAATVFLIMQLSAAKGDIINLDRKISSIDFASFKSEISAFDTKLERISKENDKLKSDLAQLKNEIEAVKARKEKADASAQKQPAVKKKAANKNPAKNPRVR